jgi:hypothetical protein
MTQKKKNALINAYTDLAKKKEKRKKRLFLAGTRVYVLDIISEINFSAL